MARERVTCGECLDLEGARQGKSSESLDLRKSVDLGESGKSSELSDLGQPRDKVDFTPPRLAAGSPTQHGTLGTVGQDSQLGLPALIPQHGSTGERKPYNVRLTKSLVAEAMDKAESEGLSLAQVIERLLEGYVRP